MLFSSLIKEKMALNEFLSIVMIAALLLANAPAEDPNIVKSLPKTRIKSAKELMTKSSSSCVPSYFDDSIADIGKVRFEHQSREFEGTDYRIKIYSAEFAGYEDMTILLGTNEGEFPYGSCTLTGSNAGDFTLSDSGNGPKLTRADLIAEFTIYLDCTGTSGLANTTKWYILAMSAVVDSSSEIQEGKNVTTEWFKQQDGFIGDEYCSSTDVWDYYRTWTLNGSDWCYDDSAQLKETCDYDCDSGACIFPACFNNTDCGTDGLINNTYCNSTDVWDYNRTWTCNNPGTLSAFCDYSDTGQLVEICADTCESGSCVTVECYDNTDCGTDYNTSVYCSGSDVYYNSTTYTCSSPGTSSSSCSNATTPVLNETCAYGCADGACLPNPDQDGDGFNFTVDCDDDNASIYPGADEICNLADDNCDNQTDEGACPDLVISSYEYYWPQNPAANDWIMFKIVLENPGFEPAANIYWMMDTNSSDNNTGYGPFNLEVNDFINIYPQYKYALPGNYTPVFIVDNNDLVIEVNETNNQVVIPVAIG